MEVVDGPGGATVAVAAAIAFVAVVPLATGLWRRLFRR
jgi:threonine/homoserine efflux transporter RhtA